MKALKVTAALMSTVLAIGLSNPAKAEKLNPRHVVYNTLCGSLRILESERVACTNLALDMFEAGYGLEETKAQTDNYIAEKLGYDVNNIAEMTSTNIRNYQNIYGK